jgi:CII-binding regulator of phage lambda lysogenization HflD
MKICKEDVDYVGTSTTVTKLEMKCSGLKSELVETKENAKVLEDKLNESIEKKNVLEEKNSVLTKQLEDTKTPACQNCVSSLENTSNKLEQGNVRER